MAWPLTRRQSQRTELTLHFIVSSPREPEQIRCGQVTREDSCPPQLDPCWPLTITRSARYRGQVRMTVTVDMLSAPACDQLNAVLFHTGTMQCTAWLQLVS